MGKEPCPALPGTREGTLALPQLPPLRGDAGAPSPRHAQGPRSAAPALPARSPSALRWKGSPEGRRGAGAQERGLWGHGPRRNERGARIEASPPRNDPGSDVPRAASADGGDPRRKEGPRRGEAAGPGFPGRCAPPLRGVGGPGRWAFAPPPRRETSAVPAAATSPAATHLPPLLPGHRAGLVATAGLAQLLKPGSVLRAGRQSLRRQPLERGGNPPTGPRGRAPPGGTSRG